MDALRRPGALAKRVGLAPGHQASAGKRLSGRTIPGNRSLRAVLLEAAQAAGRTQARYVGAQYRRMARTKGAQRAVLSVVHPLVVDLWCRLARPPADVDLGVKSFDHRDHQRVTRQAVKHLESFGYPVTLTPAS